MHESKQYINARDELDDFELGCSTININESLNIKIAKRNCGRMRARYKQRFCAKAGYEFIKSSML